MDKILEQLSVEDRVKLEKGLRTPDLYPAQNIKAALEYINISVSISDIHEWRRSRGIRKASC